MEELPILYRDAYLIAVHKPAGLLVHKSPIDKHETRYAMKIVRNQIDQWVYPVHRLDKPTSGVLVFALSPDIAAGIGEQFENHLVEKQYQAFVRGFTDDSGEIDHPLKEIAAFKSEQAKCDEKEAKSAFTRYTTLQRFELPFADGRFPTSRYSLVELYPKSGRKHQLRRHLKHISHPIIGDVKYGKGPHNRLFREKFDSERLMLACTKMSFSHPKTQEKINIQTPPQACFFPTHREFKMLREQIVTAPLNFRLSVRYVIEQRALIDTQG